MADQFSEALRAAAKEGNLSTIQLLLEQQALVDAVDAVRSTQEHLEELLDRELEHLMADDSFNTALHYASYNGHLQCIELLLDRQADIQLADHAGFSPLHAAVLSGHLQCVELLLARRADINAVDDYDLTPLHCAAHKRQRHIVELLVEYGADKTIRDVRAS